MSTQWRRRSRKATAVESSFTNEAVDNNNSNFLNEIKNVITNNNQNNNRNNTGKCNNMNLNKLYKKYGTLGFNNNL